MSRKTTRREFIIATVSGVVGLAIGASLGWFSRPPEVIEKTVTSAITKTVTVTATPTMPSPTSPTTTTPAYPELDPVAVRALNGVKKLIESGAVKPGATIRILHVAGSRANLEKAIEIWSKYVP